MDHKILLIKQTKKVIHFLYKIKLCEALSEGVLFHSGCNYSRNSTIQVSNITFFPYFRFIQTKAKKSLIKIGKL